MSWRQSSPSVRPSVRPRRPVPPHLPAGGPPLIVSPRCLDRKMLKDESDSCRNKASRGRRDTRPLAGVGVRCRASLILFSSLIPLSFLSAQHDFLARGRVIWAKEKGCKDYEITTEYRFSLTAPAEPTQPSFCLSSLPVFHRGVARLSSPLFSHFPIVVLTEKSPVLLWSFCFITHTHTHTVEAVIAFLVRAVELFTGFSLSDLNFRRRFDAHVKLLFLVFLGVKNGCFFSCSALVFASYKLRINQLLLLD